MRSGSRSPRSQGTEDSFERGVAAWMEVNAEKQAAVKVDVQSGPLQLAVSSLLGLVRSLTDRCTAVERRASDAESTVASMQSALRELQGQVGTLLDPAGREADKAVLDGTLDTLKEEQNAAVAEMAGALEQQQLELFRRQQADLQQALNVAAEQARYATLLEQRVTAVEEQQGSHSDAVAAAEQRQSTALGSEVETLASALTAVIGRVEAVEKDQETAAAASALASEYSDRLDNLYATLELDRRHVAQAARADTEDRVRLIHSLPAFKRYSSRGSRHPPKPDPAPQPDPDPPPLESRSKRHRSPPRTTRHALSPLTDHDPVGDGWTDGPSAAPSPQPPSPPPEPSVQRGRTGGVSIPPRPRAGVSPTRNAGVKHLREPKLAGPFPSLSQVEVRQFGAQFVDAGEAAGAVIVSMQPLGVAALCGWSPGDLISGLDGVPVHTASDLARRVQRGGPLFTVSRVAVGDDVTLTCPIQLPDSPDQSPAGQTWC
eukprot:Hpha_TRINITY_DN11415_c0_g1::TRINITY_DN11415_c0_g1_i2::g.137343::m.137343